MAIIDADETKPPHAPCSPRSTDAGPVVDTFGASYTADHSTADMRQDLLSDELHHRVQNTLAVVLALARLTARSCTTIEEFHVAFEDRVQALARTNALLLRGKAQAIDVRAAVELELEPYASPGGPVTLECEALTISRDSALSLSLLIHELATNAAKYCGGKGKSHDQSRNHFRPD